MFVLNDKLTTLDRVILCASEFLGTAVLVFLGCTGCVNFSSDQLNTYVATPHEQISLTFGLAVMVSVQCFGHISGSHINPIVTVAAAVCGDLALIEVPIYFIGQFAGAIAGYGLLMAITPATYYDSSVSSITINGSLELVRSSVGVCSPGVNAKITPLQGMFTEFIISLILVLICCAVWDHRNSTKHDSVAIKFGLTVAVLAMAGGAYTGANMNPARSFAPALWNGDWENHWVYWVGPLAAGFIGGGLYRLVFSTPKPQHNERNNVFEGIPLNDKV